jgi:predicted RND superfamily exporter protein
LKKQAKEQNYSVSELVESVIEKHFYEEKADTKLDEIKAILEKQHEVSKNRLINLGESIVKNIREDLKELKK